MPYKLYLYSYPSHIPFSATSYYWVAEKKRCGIKQEQRRASSELAGTKDKAEQSRPGQGRPGQSRAGRQAIKSLARNRMRS